MHRHLHGRQLVKQYAGLSRENAASRRLEPSAAGAAAHSSNGSPGFLLGMLKPDTAPEFLTFCNTMRACLKRSFEQTACTEISVATSNEVKRDNELTPGIVVHTHYLEATCGHPASDFKCMSHVLMPFVGMIH